MTTRRHALAVAIAAAFVLSFSSGCALTAKAPTQPQVTSARTAAVDLVDSFTVGVGLVDEIGEVAKTSPALSVAEKDQFDCLIKKALGDDAPAPVVTRICGPVPTRTSAGLRAAVRDLKNLTDAPSRANTIRVALEVTQPLWELASRSKDPRIATLGAILKLTLKPATVPAGGVS